MKVYVITSGEYSAYGICAVTLDKEQAELLKVRYSDKWDEAYIEEYDTDDYKIEASDINKHKYKVVFNESHEIHTCNEINYSYGGKHGEIDDCRLWFKYADGSRKCYSYIVVIYVDAYDEDHAKKIAKDIYMKWLAEQNNL